MNYGMAFIQNSFVPDAKEHGGGSVTDVEAIAQRVVALLLEQGAVEEKRLMDVPQAAVYLGRSTRAIEALIQRGVIPTVKLDCRTQLDKRALDKLIAEKEIWQRFDGFSVVRENPPMTKR